MHGSRRFTEGLDSALRYAAAFPQSPTVSRTQATAAARKAFPALGLKSASWAVLEILIDLSPREDWTTPGRQPVIWPSNRRLCQHTGMPLRTLRNHIRRLIDAGLIAPIDSANGKRFCRRDAEGDIVAYGGFNLAPLAVRHASLLDLARAYDLAANTVRDLRADCTRSRRMVQSILDEAARQGLEGEWSQITRDLAGLSASHPDETKEALALRREALASLASLAADRFRDAVDELKLAPRGDHFGTHILTTTNLSPGICNKTRSDANAPQAASGDASGVGRGFRRKRGGAVGAPQVRQPREDESSPLSSEPVSMGLVLTACPEIKAYGRIADWADLVSVAAAVRPLLGINEDAWKDACATLGRETAAAGVALILQRHENGEVASPGGFLRAITAKARRGELHLARSFHGLASRAGPSQLRGLVQ
jgi:replication initiation protein RepC